MLVDGRSDDDTVAVAKALRPDVRIVLEKRRGKGVALAAGFAAATGDIIVMLDADGSTDPAEIPRFVSPLLEGADFAKGSRFMAGGATDDITPVRRLGNSALNGTVNVLYGTRYTDLCYGYNAFWSHCLPVLSLGQDHGFEIETRDQRTHCARGPDGGRGAERGARAAVRREQAEPGPRRAPRAAHDRAREEPAQTAAPFHSRG